jgi:hypothetical protein
MKTIVRIIPLLVLTALLIAGAALAAAADHPVAASTSAASTSGQPAAGTTFELSAGNYCVGCHLPDDPYVAAPTAWTGGIERTDITGCPAAKTIQEEMYYTERLLLAIERAQANLPAGADLARFNARQNSSLETYARLLDTPVTSLAAFQSEAQTLRYALGKNYTLLNDLIESARSQMMLVGGVLVSLVVLISLGWGYYNARKFASMASGPAGRWNWALGGMIVAFVFVLFSLPLFRVFSQAAAVTSAEAQEVQAVLDETSRQAVRSENALARAWMLGRVSAAWYALDADKAQEGLEMARQALVDSRQDVPALWGEMQAAREAAAGTQVDEAAAAIIAADLAGVQARTWNLRMIALEWAPVNEELARELLTQAETEANQALGLYRDLDLRATAVAWAALDEAHAVQVLERITDPAVRSWGYWELALRSGAPAYFEQAIQSAYTIQDPVQKVRTLARIAAVSNRPELAREAQELVAEMHPRVQAYLLAELAAATGDAALVEAISPEYPAARTLAYLKIGDFDAAWESASQIEDPFEQARAQAVIVAAGGRPENSALIAIPYLADRARRDVIWRTGDESLAASIDTNYYQVQALTELGDYPGAWAAAEGLGDAYPLVALAEAWASVDPQAASEVVAAMQRETDKAVGLQAIAMATGSQEDFDRALGMALAARVRGDVLAPAQASLDLAWAFINDDAAKLQAALAQALEAASRITVR